MHDLDRGIGRQDVALGEDAAVGEGFCDFGQNISLVDIGLVADRNKLSET